MAKLIAAALLLMAWTSVAAPVAAQTGIEAELQRRIESMLRTGVLRTGEVDVPAARVIAAVYQRRDFAPLWHTPERRAGLVEALRTLERDGLDPEHYHLRRLERLAGDGATSADRQSGDDLLFTVAWLQAAQHLRFGRVDPATLAVRRGLDRALRGSDAAVEAGMLLAMEPAAAFRLLRPQHYAYYGLMGALSRLRWLAGSGGLPTIPAGRLARDSTGPAVPLLRARLALEGDLPTESLPMATGTQRFDDVLDAAVRSFQRRHGLNDDGIVGPATLRELNVPVEVRMDQIRVNLERGRWLLHDLPATFVVVNIAGATVYFIRDREPVLLRASSSAGTTRARQCSRLHSRTST
jgi:L,D-transpeptidase YcbB